MKATISDLYDLTHTIAAPLLERFTYPWDALAHIKDFILELGPTPQKACGLPRMPRCSTVPIWEVR